MRNSNIRLVILLGAITILSIIAMQTYWLVQRWNHESRSFDQSTRVALLRVARELATLNGSTLPSGEIIKQITPNYYTVNFNDVIDANVLEYLLLKEFSSLELYTDFEYGIFDCTSNEMVYGNHCNLIGPERSPSDKKLPPYTEFTYYFGVKFPSHQANLRASSGSIWIFSLIAAIAVIFFVYSIWVILNQRRYSEMQRDFINNMTHEFKTPLTSIQLSSDYLSNQPAIKNDERLSRYTELIRSQYQRLNDQVEKLLNIARIDSDEFALKKEDVNLHELIDEVVESKAAEEGLAGRVFNKRFEATAFKVKGDQSHLTSVINNLVDNAVKYSPVGEPIDIVTSNKDGKLKVEIIDRGFGIAPEHQKHLFKRFYRVPSGNVHNIKGFGLGLNYVKKIINLHKGMIGVKSAIGEGSTFYFYLPTN